MFNLEASLSEISADYQKPKSEGFRELIGNEKKPALSLSIFISDIREFIRKSEKDFGLTTFEGVVFCCDKSPDLLKPKQLLLPVFGINGRGANILYKEKLIKANLVTNELKNGIRIDYQRSHLRVDAPYLVDSPFALSEYFFYRKSIGASGEEIPPYFFEQTGVLSNFYVPYHSLNEAKDRSAVDESFVTITDWFGEQLDYNSEAIDDLERVLACTYDSYVGRTK